MAYRVRCEGIVDTRPTKHEYYRMWKKERCAGLFLINGDPELRVDRYTPYCICVVCVSAFGRLSDLFPSQVSLGIPLNYSYPFCPHSQCVQSI